MKKIREIATEHIKPVIAVKRCPRCHELSLDFDIKNGRIYCMRCGFEEFVPLLEAKK